MSEYDVVISLQFLHSNRDSCALSKAALSNNGGPLVAAADSIVPSLRIPSTTVTSPVMCATREIGGYIGGDNLAKNDISMLFVGRSRFLRRETCNEHGQKRRDQSENRQQPAPFHMTDSILNKTLKLTSGEFTL